MREAEFTNVSLGTPCERYAAAAGRSPRVSASRYERTTAAARSSPAAAWGGAGAGATLTAGGVTGDFATTIGLCVMAVRTGDGVGLAAVTLGCTRNAATRIGVALVFGVGRDVGVG